MIFDPTLTLGNVLTLLTMLGGAAVFWIRLVRRLDRIDWKVHMIWRWYQKEHNIENDH